MAFIEWIIRWNYSHLDLFVLMSKVRKCCVHSLPLVSMWVPTTYFPTASQHTRVALACMQKRLSSNWACLSPCSAVWINLRGFSKFVSENWSQIISTFSNASLLKKYEEHFPKTSLSHRNQKDINAQKRRSESCETQVADLLQNLKKKN